MRTIETKLFQFDELDDKAKEKARQWWRECDAGDNFWSECTIEEAVREGEFLGIEFKDTGRKTFEPAIYWSGFSSQGDGACFEGVWRAGACQPEKVADGWGDSPSTTELRRIAAVFGEIAKEWPTASFSVAHSGHYSHEFCTEFDVTMDEDPDMVVPDGIEKELIEVAREFMKWIYRALEAAYEYHNSDEQVDESIKINEYEFEEDGTRA